jgi:hypothetical protein
MSRYVERMWLKDLGQRLVRLGLLWVTMVGLGTIPIGAAPLEDTKAHDFFLSTNLVVFRIEVPDAELRALEENPRAYVCGTVRVPGLVLERVGIRLKGTGTFEPVSARPSLALKFNWQKPHQRFSGLHKLFLENSDQDASRLCKMVANALFAEAGIPAPRITQARVELNGRNLGLYVVSEAVNHDFLQSHFGSNDGNLYEAEFRDITSHLKQDNGPPGDQSDLKQLCAAARQSDPAHRQESLARILNLEEVLDFLAVEILVANWDGYVFQQNNYRIYHDPHSGKMNLIPHDLDNTLSEFRMALMPPRKGLLTSALLETREQREAFRRRMANLLPKLLEPARVGEIVQRGVSRLAQGPGPDSAAVVQRQAALLMKCIEQRRWHLTDELAGKRPATPVFEPNGFARLEGWRAKTDWNGSLAKAVVEEGRPTLKVQAANGYCFASWRLPVWLPAGTYRLEAKAKTMGVAGLPSRTGSGAGVRALGNRRGSGLQNSSDWASVRHEFVVQEDCESVELIAELRAYAGTAWFDPETFRLVRVR